MSQYSPSSAITPELVARIQKAIEAVPPSHRRPPTADEIVEDQEAGFERLQGWAFTQGFALVVESRTKKRLRAECANHHKKTKGWRKTKEDDRVRPNTVSLAKDCPYALYISYLQHHNA